MNLNFLIKQILTFLILQISFLPIFAQQLGLTFQEAEMKGIRISYLDSIYKSAVHRDTSLAVFKTDKEQESMSKAYIELLQNFGKFLVDNSFKWDHPARCFNRIYFNTEGTIDYFLFNFLGKTKEEKPSESKQAEFKRLLNLFIKDYKLPLTAKTKFAQCSPATYMPNK